MTVYRLSAIGVSVAKNPNRNDTNTLKVINWLYRHGYQATDDTLTAYTGVTKYELASIARDKKAIVAVG